MKKHDPLDVAVWVVIALTAVEWAWLAYVVWPR
jgi:hypothetical protein